MAKIILADLGITPEEIASGAYVSIAGYVKANTNVTTTLITFDTAGTIAYLATEVRIRISYFTVGDSLITEYVSLTLPGLKTITTEQYMFIENAIIPSNAEYFDMFIDYKFASADPRVTLNRIQVNRGAKSQPYAGSTAAEVAELSTLVDPGGTGSTTGLNDLIRWTAGTNYDAIVSKGTAEPTGGTEGDIYFQLLNDGPFLVNDIGDLTAVKPWGAGFILYADTPETLVIASLATASISAVGHTHVKADITDAYVIADITDFTDNSTNWDNLINSSAPASSSGTLTLNIANGNYFETTLSEDITTMTVSNLLSGSKGQVIELKIKQDPAVVRTVVFPTGTVWSGGSAPTMTATVDAIDIFRFTTYDNGTIFYGEVVGQNFS